MDTATAENPRRPSAAKSFCVAAAALIVIWLCSLLGPLSLAVPIVGIGGLAYLLRHRRFTAALLLVIATPLSVSFLWGVVDYANGNARLRYSGLPGTTFHNLDPDLRCGRSTYGCIVTGNEWVTQAPYNGAVRLLTACFGWMPNTYDGPYPTENDARNAIANGIPVSIRDLRNDRLVIGGVSIELDQGVGLELVERLRYSDEFFGETPPEMAATIWQQECIVLRIPIRPDFEHDAPSAVVVLISRAAGRPFAYYAEGEYSHHFPPVTWKRGPT